jgi:transposase InsO family protein
MKKLNLVQSMSAPASPLDNAPIESFFGHMKDYLDYKKCKTFEELAEKVDEYMYYYNNERKQWSKKKMTPIEYREYLLAS